MSKILDHKVYERIEGAVPIRWYSQLKKNNSDSLGVLPKFSDSGNLAQLAILGALELFCMS